MMKYLIRITALVLLTAVLAGCGAAVPDPPRTVAAAVYPQESEKTLHSPFSDEKDVSHTRIPDRDQELPSNVADSLDPYFQKSIPVFLGSEGTNAICSPLNLYMALALLAETTDGDSRQEILELLNSDSIESLRDQASQIWNHHYCDDDFRTCILANSLWLDEGLPFRQETTDLLARAYYTSVFQGDLGSEEINSMLQRWLNEQTGGLLKEQVGNIRLDPATVLSLASTIYYRAKWSSEFNPDNNTEDIFHTPGADSTITFMNKHMSRGTYFWGDGFGALHLELDGGSRLWVLLPDPDVTPADLLEQGDALSLALGQWRETENQKVLQVNLRMPKFDAVSDKKMESALQELGIQSVFDRNGADFSPILPESKVWLDTVNHAARVKIDEVGIEAAAYTVIGVLGASRPPEEKIDFIVDRPFLFLITGDQDLPLFAGVVSNP